MMNSEMVFLVFLLLFLGRESLSRSIHEGVNIGDTFKNYFGAVVGNHTHDRDMYRGILRREKKVQEEAFAKLSEEMRWSHGTYKNTKLRIHRRAVTVDDWSAEALKELESRGMKNPTNNEKTLGKALVLKIAELKAAENKILEVEKDKQQISDVRVITAVRTRMEYLEDKLYPGHFAHQTNRNHRWQVIMHTPGEARNEFRNLVVREFRKIEAFQEKSEEEILVAFCKNMFEIYPVLSDRKEGPHSVIAPEILRILASDGAEKSKFFELMGIQMLPIAERAVAAIASSDIILVPDPKPFGNPSDYRCIVITRVKHENFPKKHGIKEITVRRFYPTVEAKSVTFAMGDQREKVGRPESLNEEVVVTGVDKIIVEFETYRDANEAYTVHQKRLKFFEVNQDFEICPSGTQSTPECPPSEGNTPSSKRSRQKIPTDKGSTRKISREAD